MAQPDPITSWLKDYILTVTLNINSDKRNMESTLEEKNVQIFPLRKAPILWEKSVSV